MDEEFNASVGVAAIGSLCIFIGISITDKLKIDFIDGIVSGFLISGFFMVFLSAAFLFGGLLKLKWEREIFIRILLIITIVVFFFSSLALAISYMLSLI